jgi:hypothetical protein
MTTSFYKGLPNELDSIVPSSSLLISFCECESGWTRP